MFDVKSYDKGGVADYYDAEEQKNINQKKFDRLWEIQQQIRDIRKIISVDPDNKGVFVKMILQNGVVEEKYIDHPERAYCRAVECLYDLCLPEIQKNPDVKTKYRFITEKFEKELWYFYPRSRAIFRLLITVIEENYGQDNSVTDVVCL